MSTAEHKRLKNYRNQKSNWKNWGPYLSERAWGTVREDYSSDGTAWEFFPHDHARSRAYRWNEDGLAGISDRSQYICFSLALWNGRDPILKERLFGLTGNQGNHGEDVKEAYFYLDSTPTHSYMKMLYKYPQAAFPYQDLIEENDRRGLDEFEYEILDTGVFDQDRYFDVFVEYAKVNEDDILVKITAVNRGPEAAELTLLPQLWFRNTWSWGYPKGPMGDISQKPHLRQNDSASVKVTHPAAGDYFLYANSVDEWLFTENETNYERLFDTSSPSPYVKDAFHRYVIEGEEAAVNPNLEGTKTAAHFRGSIEPGDEVVVRLRLTREALKAPFQQFDRIFARRLDEANEFYAAVQPKDLSTDNRHIQRQALAGMLWSKQLYYVDIPQWLEGDPGMPKPPQQRKNGRNSDWEHLNNFDLISMPDKWEYPWYAVWDSAFHCLPLAMVDPDFAKRQIILMTREWYMHPNGQLPAYEWAFGDVNPPVHAWGAWRVYQIDAEQSGTADRDFLEAVFHKLLLNFTWWVNRKDADGNNVFQGGFLGLDNISLFDRSDILPTGGHIDQADGTAWMAFYSLGMLRIALELAEENPVYQDLATKFFEHFLAIADAIGMAFDGRGLWDEEDGFFYDVLHPPDGRYIPLKVRSLVGLMPLLAVEILPHDLLERMPDFQRRMHWFMEHRPTVQQHIASPDRLGVDECHILSIITPDRLRQVLRYMLDEAEFLSPYGIRSLSKIHQTSYAVVVNGEQFSIDYQPAESRTGLFGGNSNWRGPVWFPINYLLIEALKKYHQYYGEDFTIEFPTGSGKEVTLHELATILSKRLVQLFQQNEQGERPVYGGVRKLQDDPHWRDYIWFFEYFHGDNGAGLGASHQTGWTGLVATLIQVLSAES